MAIFPDDYVEKLTIAADDMVLFSDSEDDNKLKKAKYSNLKGEKGDTALSKASGSDIDTGTDDGKFVTSKAIADSKLSYTDGTETLTNKTINGANNTISNVNSVKETRANAETKFWTGTASNIPSTKDSNTIYFGTEE